MKEIKSEKECSLWCKGKNRLCKAHLLPKWAYTPLLRDDAPLKMYTEDEYSKRVQEGVYDNNILCAECDRTIGTWGLRSMIIENRPGEIDDFSMAIIHETKREKTFIVNPAPFRRNGLNSFRFFFPYCTVVIKVDSRPLPEHPRSFAIGESQNIEILIDQRIGRHSRNLGQITHICMTIKKNFDILITNSGLFRRMHNPELFSHSFQLAWPSKMIEFTRLVMAAFGQNRTVINILSILFFIPKQTVDLHDFCIFPLQVGARYRGLPTRTYL